jgi:hypothetical protein
MKASCPVTEADWLLCDDPVPLWKTVAESATERQLNLFCEAVRGVAESHPFHGPLLHIRALFMVHGINLGGSLEPMHVNEQRRRADYIRDIFDNPFRPVTIDQTLLTWRDATIPKLAQAAYDERELPSGHLDTKRLAILADALEEAGCTNEDVLAHLRGPGPHVRGCWVVDLLLGRE